MRLSMINLNGEKIAGIVVSDNILPISVINEKFGLSFSKTIIELIETGELEELRKWYIGGGMVKLDSLNEFAISKKLAKYEPLYRNPRKIWGIGLNYVDHAADLSEKAPNTEPASFMKPDTSIIGFGDNICIPLQSDGTTAEAELGVIFSKECKDVSEENWLDVVAGFTTIIDMTAEDILRKNPRYLTRSKSFDTFFSFGPEFVTTDEVSNVLELKVSTVINNEVYASNLVSNMTFRPDYLVSFHSKVMTMCPGDIISTGTPRAVKISHGDVVECRIDGFESLVNPVIDKKRG